MSGVRKELASILADLREVEPWEWRSAGRIILASYLILGIVFWVHPTLWGQILVFLLVGALIITPAVYRAKSRRILREQLEAGLESAEELRDEVLEVWARVIEHRDELQAHGDELQALVPGLEKVQAYIEELEKLIQKLTAPKPWPKGGRPRNPDDDWAYEQVRVKRRNREEVYREWLERIGDRATSLADRRDSFNKAIKPRQ
jgi:hypothetical protein